MTFQPRNRGKHAEGVGVFQAIFDCSERQSTQASEVFSRGFHDSSNRQEKDFLGESTSGDWRMTQSRANGYESLSKRAFLSFALAGSVSFSPVCGSTSRIKLGLKKKAKHDWIHPSSGFVYAAVNTFPTAFMQPGTGADGFP